MRRLFFFVSTILVLVGCISKEQKEILKEQARKEAQIDNLLRSLTLEEKLHLCFGLGPKPIEGDEAVVDSIKRAYPGYAGATYPVRRVGIPALLLCDGPAGLRIDNVQATNEVKDYWCTSFPIGSLLASTWNNDAIEEVGRAIGNETREYGVDIILGPGQNIHRHPLGGRNYEYFSEDPFLSGMISAAYVRGVQSQGVGTSIKHFAVNNQETSRLSNDARVSQRALREIYLRNFEYTLKNSEPWTIMTSYNFINNVHASENYDLLTTIVRKEWGYKGLLVTDWGAGYDSAKQIEAGQNLIQRGKPWRYEQVVKALEEGTLTEKQIDNSVRYVLELVDKSYRMKVQKGEAPKHSGTPDLATHNYIARKISAEGMVLLKNSDCLPLNGGQKVALYGSTSYSLIAGGLGAGDVNSKYVKTLPQAFESLGFVVNKDIQKVYEAYITDFKKYMKANPQPSQARKILPGQPVIPERLIEKSVAAAEVAIVTFGRVTGEWNDALTSSFSLSKDEQELLEYLRQRYSKLIVVLNTGMVMETASWKDIPDGIILAWQGGSETASAVADLISGKVNPSGHLPVSFPNNLAEVPSSPYFPCDYTGPVNIAPWTEESGEKETIHYTNYAEDIYVGYRHYTSFNVPVSYPFGFGLSYTDFEFSNFTAENNGVETIITVDVKNVGQREGKQVAQIYVKAAESRKYDKPVRELKAYSKTKSLLPGESERLVMKVKNEDLASFDEAASAWVTDRGDYTFMLGTDVNTILKEIKVSVAGSRKKVHNVLKKQPHTPRHLEYRG
ncbi:MAG: glycoside hydrolase family 3 C-terminal domain-containing protein [Bacteroidales bacterium]|nr:glycoside hydrolase family 3 C-terminal domain-containing protein [Bacteroidales bacterium]